MTAAAPLARDHHHVHHGHDHHDHDHDHAATHERRPVPPAGTRRPAAAPAIGSLLLIGAAPRLALALGFTLGLWAVVFWALA